MCIYIYNYIDTYIDRYSMYIYILYRYTENRTCSKPPTSWYRRTRHVVPLIIVFSPCREARKIHPLGQPVLDVDGKVSSEHLSCPGRTCKTGWCFQPL